MLSKIFSILGLRKINSAVILRGGLARACVGIAMVRFLEENHIEPKLLIGSSSGAQIAGMFALGYSWKQILDDFSSFHMRELSSYSNLARHGFLFPDEDIKAFYLKRLGKPGRRFEELKHKVAFISADKETRLPILLYRGEILPAILATTAFPMIIRPQEMDGKVLMDGDFCVRYPITELKEHFGITRVITVGSAPLAGADILDRFVSLMLDRDRGINNKLNISGDGLNHSFSFDIGDMGYTDFHKTPEAVESSYRQILAVRDVILKNLVD